MLEEKKSPTGFFESPYRQEIQQSTSFLNLFRLNRKKAEVIKGNDSDWQIKLPKKDSSSDSSSSVIPNQEIYQSLQKENEWAWETIELLTTGWYQNKLWLDSIEDEKEAEEAIINLLVETVINWRKYLESDDKDIFYKMPFLGAFFSQHKIREEASQTITWIDQALIKRITWDELLTKWSRGKKTWDEMVDYNWGASLWAFIQLLYLKKKYQSQN